MYFWELIINKHRLLLMWLIQGIQSWAVTVKLKFIRLEQLQRSGSEQICFVLNFCFFRVQTKSNFGWWGASKGHGCEWRVASVSIRKCQVWHWEWCCNSNIWNACKWFGPWAQPLKKGKVLLPGESYKTSGLVEISG